MNTTIDVIGAGGAGGFLASALCKGGLPPRIIARGPSLQRLREAGLTIIYDNRPSRYAPISCKALDDIEQLAPLVLLAVKSYDISSLLEKLTARATEDTLFITIQNGFAAYDTLSHILGTERTAMGVLYVSAQTVSPAVIDVKPGIAQLFLPEEYERQLLPIADAFNAGDVEAGLVDDIERRMWIKQLFLVPFAIINAEMRQPIGTISQDAGARKRWAAIAQEIATVARACGIKLPRDAVAMSLTKAEHFDPLADSSFARDVWANRPHEAEALFGPILERARQHDIQCPLLQQAYDYYLG
jgi:2-dehydropantoate 2-reductase